MRQRAPMVAGICAGFLVLMVAGLIGRLWYLQMRLGEHFAQRSRQNYTRMQTTPAPRGALYDSAGHCIARDRAVFKLYWQGAGRRDVTTQQAALIEQIARISGDEVEVIAQKARRAERWRLRVAVASRVGFDDMSALICLPDARQIIGTEESFIREYPCGVMASHVLGSMSALQASGKSGLEQRCQSALQGVPGKVRAQVNARGVPVLREVVKPAQAGKSLQLTIDMRLQYLAHVLFGKDQAGTCILMDAQSGAIKTLVSYPEYDPAMFVQSLSHKQWQERVADNQPFLNRACMALYPPASLFKIVTYAAGLEQEVVQADTVVNCTGSVTLGGHKYWCIRRWGHGHVALEKAFAVSCNTACYHIAQQLSIDELAEYAYRCGLGRKTGFVLAEKAGLMPTAEWKAMHKGERWWQGETLSCAIGQSYVLCTPLQIARMVAGVCTGSLVRPRLLVDERVAHEPLLLSAQTQNFLREAMRRVVNDGSGRLLRPLPDFEIYAKTGTAQTTGMAKQSTRREDQEHAWLACYFSYKNEQPMILVVLIEHMGSARPAVLFAQRFLEKYGLLRHGADHATLTEVKKTGQ